MTETKRFTAEEKHREARREVEMRLDVYPRLADQRKLTHAEAARRIEIMQSIADDYETLAQKERLV